MNISTARVVQQINVPIRKLAKQSHFQGAAWAKDPNTGEEFVWQMQAQPVGPGDVEDLYVHRYSLKGGVLTFVDTMVGKGWGHCQTVKVRISAASNPYLLLGWERYDPKTFKQVGQQVFRVRYKPVVTDRNYAYATRVWINSAWVVPLDCPDWTIATRRSAGTSEVYEWWDERELLAATEGKWAKPRAAITIPKVTAYQGACVSGTAAAPDSVFRINGALDTPASLWQYKATGDPNSCIDLTNVISGNADPEEPECVFHVGEDLWVGKQTSPVSRRILAYVKLDLS